MGESKLAGEIAVREAFDRHVILRTSWLFGAYRKNFLKTMLQARRRARRIARCGDQRGCPTSTADLADAIVAIAPRLAAGERALRHLPCCKPAVRRRGMISRMRSSRRLAPFTGRSPKVVPIGTQDYPTKAARPVNSELDSSKFFSAVGFRAADWRERVREVVAALKGRAEAEIA